MFNDVVTQLFVFEHVGRVGRSGCAALSGAPDPGHGGVGIVYGGTNVCTAVLVGQKTVLTASICVDAGGALPSFLTGADLSNVSNATKHDVVKVTVHPQASDTGLDYKVAILELATAPALTPSALTDATPAAGMGVTLVGYGSTSSTASDSGKRRALAESVTAVAAGTFEVGASGVPACNGDAGGPAYVNVGGQEAQIGLTLASSTNCGPPAVLLRVDKLLSWIETASGNDVTVVSGTVVDGGVSQDASVGIDSQKVFDQAITDTAAVKKDTNAADQGAPVSSDSSGCAVAESAPTASLSAWLMLLGLALLLRGRRRR